MGELERMDKTFKISFKADERGFVGRECPDSECIGYFKIDIDSLPKPLKTDEDDKADDAPENPERMTCPYCGHEDEFNEFTTSAQMEYGKSIVYQKVFGALVKDLKAMEFDIKPKGMFGIGFSMKLKAGPTPSIRYYKEQDLETDVACDCCGFRFTIYGVFGFCPACRSHNSLQILDKSLAVAEKLLDRAAKEEDTEVREQIVGDALSKSVAACDGFGRCICEVHAAKASDPKRLERLSFQNLVGARKNVQDLFGLDIAATLAAAEWEAVCRSFQKRHLLAHSMGVIDEEYVAKANDARAVVGRKISISDEEVRQVCAAVRTIGRTLNDGLNPIIHTSAGTILGAQTSRSGGP